MRQVPSAWKEAAVVPIYKGGDISLAKNYRPTSLTFTIMKVLERIIRKQLVDFLSDHNYFNPNQHGFRHSRSCLSVLLDVYDTMMTSLSNNPKSSVDMIYLDYAKAFDKVDHGVILNKLKKLAFLVNWASGCTVSQQIGASMLESQAVLVKVTTS